MADIGHLTSLQSVKKPALLHRLFSWRQQAERHTCGLAQALLQTSELIRMLKRQKKQSPLVASTHRSLKELQQAGQVVPAFGKMEKMLAPPLLAPSSHLVRRFRIVPEAFGRIMADKPCRILRRPTRGVSERRLIFLVAGPRL